jgi:hypothetical protein
MVWIFRSVFEEVLLGFSYFFKVLYQLVIQIKILAAVPQKLVSTHITTGDHIQTLS